MDEFRQRWPFLALVLFLLIPLDTVLGGMLANLINPEIAAGHPNYVRNFHLLSLLKITVSIWFPCGCGRVVAACVPSGDPLKEAIVLLAIAGGTRANRVRQCLRR
jgi:hypothetical protein